MGRHSSAKARGWRSTSPVVALCVLLVLAVGGWFTVDFLSERMTASDCDTTTVLNVTAAPDIAPVIARSGRMVSTEDQRGCYEVRVSNRGSSATAESLVVSDGTERPDVWIPESTIWLQRAQTGGAWPAPVAGTSIASSPVVLALTEDAATQLGWPAAAPTWPQVVGPAARDFAIGLPDPGREPVGISLLFGIRQLTRATADPAKAMTTELRSLSPSTEEDMAGLFARLPGGTTTDEPLDGFPTSENSVLRHNVKQTGTQLVAAYADPPVPALDYPFVVLPETSAAKRAAAERFLRLLLGQDTAEALSDAGFRTPDGQMLRKRDTESRTSTAKMTPVRLPNADDVDQLLNEWAGVNLSGRVQVLLDVSGSMNEPVPGTGATRMAVTLQAAELGIGIMRPTTKLGIWLFSTDLDGPGKDYRELLPVKPISEHAASGGIAQLRAVQALPNGATGLYDSTLAAYQSARQNFEPGRINTVIVLTDGRNDDDSGITRDLLLVELGKLQDPRRPIRVIGIGIGTDIDVGELQAIAGATGGQAFTTPDPTQIGDIFHAALSRLLCQPPACTQPTG